MRIKLKYCILVALGVGLTVGVRLKYQSDIGLLLDHYRIQERDLAEGVAHHVEDALGRIYRGLRTIARLPGVRGIQPGRAGLDFHGGGSGFQADARLTVQELYNNLALSVTMSEVYIVPLDMDPEPVDPDWDGPREPWVTFDELIIGRHADRVPADLDHEVEVEREIEEIEIHEYRLMKQQLAWMREHVPTVGDIEGMAYPGIGGREVVTCDNRFFSPDDPDDGDRSGLVYSVPFYGLDGRLKGCVSGVVLTRVLAEHLTSGEYAIRHIGHDYTVSAVSDALAGSGRWIARGQADPGLLYSQVIALEVPDVAGPWLLWSGEADGSFWSRNDVHAAREFAVWAHVAVVGLMIAWGLVTWLMDRNRMILERAYEELERRVHERTIDLENASEQVIAATRAKTAFLANMSHELRTPMTAILGYSDLLLDSDATDSDRLNSIYTIRRNGRHLLNLINDILDVSKVEAGKMEIERVTVGTWPLLRDVLDLLTGKAEEKGLVLKAEIVGGGIPEQIESDPTRLKQALVNLVGNSIKFTEHGGVRIVVSCDHGSQMMTFSVIDDGIGMTEAQMAKLFRPFTQADLTTTRRYGGTGLGLTITKRIAELLGGGVTVQTEWGKGSTFKFTVKTGPLEGVQMVTAVDPRPTAVPETTRDRKLPSIDGRVLLVEDGPDNQRLISFMLRKAGADVTVADQGHEGFIEAMSAKAEGRAFGVILMDMQMPVMDGYEATRMLRAQGYDGQVVALTAHAMKGELEKCLVAGCDHYLSKPIDRAVLVREVARRMGMRSQKGQELGTVKPVP